LAGFSVLQHKSTPAGVFCQFAMASDPVDRQIEKTLENLTLSERMIWLFFAVNTLGIIIIVEYLILK